MLPLLAWCFFMTIAKKKKGHFYGVKIKFIQFIISDKLRIWRDCILLAIRWISNLEFINCKNMPLFNIQYSRYLFLVGLPVSVGKFEEWHTEMLISPKAWQILFNCSNFWPINDTNSLVCYLSSWFINAECQRKWLINDQVSYNSYSPVLLLLV